MCLTVVLPVRNGGTFLRRSIDSILQQSFSSFEFIVVDNVSTDDTIATVESFRDQRIQLVREPRLGGPIAFNTGWRLARGDYIARMDGDDVASLDRFTQQIAYLEDHTDVGVLGAQIVRLDNFGTTIGRSHFPLSPSAVRHAARHIFPVSNPTLIFRREVLYQIGGYREFAPGADYDMLLRALEAGVRIANLPTVLLQYRIRDDSASHANSLRKTTNWSKVRTMAKLRARGRYVDERNLLDEVCNTTKTDAPWFRMVDGVVSYWKKYRSRRKRGAFPRTGALIAHVIIGLFSVLHPLVAKETWAAFRGTRIDRIYRSRGGR